MIGIGPWQRRRMEAHPAVAEPEDLTWRAALLIGCLQCLAMWPGTSRSMITIVAAMLVGMRPRQAAEFSFLLALPTLGGACVFKLAQDVAGSGPSMLAQLGLAPVVVGVVVAAVAAALAVKWLVHYLNRHGLAVFGWYRLALSAVFVVLLAGGWLAIGPPVPNP
jgi:undecaprenyl-diphosphatase